MRGKPDHRPWQGTVRGITPADAGKTTPTQSMRLSRWDHPRGCGENAGTASVSYPPPGSPPRMRGKPDEVTAYQAEARITPADAGKTSSAFSPYFSSQDHPRGCGENLEQLRFDTSILGSPPRMRGKLPKIDANCTVSEDHPRGCGENPETVRNLAIKQGSPPRMRGKPNDETSISAHTGITPADAGKTSETASMP